MLFERGKLEESAMAPKTAVIIDDEPDITTYFETLLTDNGWSVRAANDPNEGIALAQETPPDVILLDVMMPERGGLSTLIALRKDERTAKVPVVLVTGIQESLTVDFGVFLDRFKKYHPDAYLQKPVNEADLLQTMESVTSRSGHEAASPA
jgi:CheY-like chemotaxis protein